METRVKNTFKLSNYLSFILKLSLISLRNTSDGVLCILFAKPLPHDILHK